MGSRTTRPQPHSTGGTSAGARASWGLALGLAVLTLAAYAGVASLGFVDLDDPQYVSGNEVVLRGLTAEGLRYAFTSTVLGNWHPLTWLSHMLVAELAGADPGPHHLANLALHLACVLLLYGLLLRTTGKPLPSALAAGLFAVHPLHVESVAWVAERKDVLSTAFWLLALQAWVGWTRRGGAHRYGATLLAFMAGLMSKPMLVTLPFTLLLLDLWPLRRWRWIAAAPGLPARRLLVEKAPLFALTVAWSVVTLLVQQGEGAMEFGDTVAPPMRVANAVRSCGVYLAQTLWPTHLAVWYPYPDELPWLQVMGAAGAIVALSAVCLLLARRAPYAITGWLWFLGTLVPVLGLVQVGNQAHADRYTYVPHIGLFAALAFGLAALARAAPRLRLALAGLACAALAVCTLLTADLVRAWHDDESLFAHAVEATGGSTLAHDHLAHAAQARARIDEAIAHYRSVVELAPDMASGHVNLGAALEQRGDAEGALRCYEKALELDPANANASSNIGAILARSGRNADAAPYFARAVELAPDKAGLVFNLALNELLLGRRAEAARHFRRAVELDPLSAEGARSDRFAWILATHPDASVRDGELALRIATRLAGLRRDPSTLEVLAAAQAECGRFPEAGRSAQEALEAARAAGQAELATRLEAAVTAFASGQPLRVP